GHDLLVRTGKMREIRSPETALWAESIDHAADKRVKGRKWIRLVHITRQRGHFHGDILKPRKLDDIIDRGTEWFAAQGRVKTHMIDDEPQAGVMLGNFS